MWKKQSMNSVVGAVAEIAMRCFFAPLLHLNTDQRFNESFSPLLHIHFLTIASTRMRRHDFKSCLYFAEV